MHRREGGRNRAIAEKERAVKEKKRNIGNLQQKIQEQEKTIRIVRGEDGGEGNQGKPKRDERQQ